MTSQFLEIASAAIHNGECRQAVLSKPRAPSDAVARKITIRPVVIRGRAQYQWTFQFAQKQTHENHEPAATIKRIQEHFGKVYAHCHLFSASADYSARHEPGGEVTLQQTPPTKNSVSLEHDRSKNYLIPEGTPCPFLAEAGVMTAGGKVKAAKRHKFRQINRFLELVADVAERLPGDGVLQVVDFGCGKSYLTFALHHLLTSVYKREVNIVGLDLKTDVINHCNQTAQRLNCRGLKFQAGDISAFQPTGRVDLTVWLHACDTATDEALAHAIAWETAVVLAVPCCQHEFNSQLTGKVLPVIEQYGLLKERFAAIATDALRAQVLEICGYQTQVVEFIDLEHTAKNVLLRALRRQSDDPNREAKLAAYREFKQFLQIERPHLEAALATRGVQLSGLVDNG